MQHSSRMPKTFLSRVKKALLYCCVKTLAWTDYLLGVLLTAAGIPERLATPKALPQMKHHLLFKSATQLAKMIREKQITSVEVVQVFVDRCKAVNPLVNAIVQDRYSEALQEAAEVDQRVREGQLSQDQLEEHFPLLGVPFSVKECVAVKGLSNGCGVWSPDPLPPAAADAVVVAQMRKAGAIPLLVTNTPESCVSLETYNLVTGLTRNPYNTTRTCGGSSGGEGCILGAGGSVIGLGTDAAGSLRMPAHYTGIFSLKPSSGLVQFDGIKPELNMEIGKTMATAGPMTRYSEDLRIVLKIIVNPEKSKLQLDNKVPMKDIKFFYLMDDHSWFSDKPDADIHAAMQKVIMHFQNNLNISLQEVKLKSYRKSFLPSVGRFIDLGIHAQLGPGTHKLGFWRVFKELLKKCVGFSNMTQATISYGFMRLLFENLSKSSREYGEGILKNLTKELKDLLGSNGVLLLPNMPTCAHYHHDCHKRLMNINYMVLANVTGTPAVSLPVQLSREGLPVGLQAVAGHLQDHLLLSVAEEFERAFGGWLPPSAPQPT